MRSYIKDTAGKKYDIKGPDKKNLPLKVDEKEDWTTGSFLC